MVKTRAQRVTNEENGVAQSPPQALSTPRKPRKGAAGKTLNNTVRNAQRVEQTNGKVSESDDSSRQTKSSEPAKSSSRTGIKKAKLRNAAKQVQSKSLDDVSMSTEHVENDGEQSEERENEVQVNGTSRSARTSRETSKEPTKKKTTTKKPTKAISKSQQAEKERIENESLQAAPTQTTNGGLFNLLSSVISPRRPEPEPEKEKSAKQAPGPEKMLPKRKSASPIPTKPAEAAKSKAKSQRVLQEHGANQRKPAPSRSRMAGNKRKREEPQQVDSESDLSDAPELKKKTARYSFKPNAEGLLAPLPRDEIDPEDLTVVFVEGDEAARLISQNFERTKKVRFADRIAKQHPESTEEEKSIHQAELEKQNLQLTTQGFFGEDLRTLARKLNSESQTLLEKIDNLSTSNDDELREALADDLIRLAMALRAAGPQSKSASPVLQIAATPWNKQDDKENNSATPSPESRPRMIEAPPTPHPTGGNQSATSISTPGRLFASIRRVWPFGGSSTPEATTTLSTEQQGSAQIPDSPTPASRVSQQTRSKTIQSSNSSEPVSKVAEAPKTPRNTKIHLSDFGPGVIEEQKANAERKSADMVNQMNANWEARRTMATPKTPGSLRKKIGSEAFPLTVNGKIPRPATNAFGINDKYFYEADSDSSSNEDETDDAPVFKRRRLNADKGVSARDKADQIRLTRSAPRPHIMRPPIKAPAPRVIQAPDLSSSEESEEELTVQTSNTGKQSEENAAKAEKMKNAADAHRPKTPSRLRQMSTVPPSPIDVKARLQKHFTGKQTKGVLNVFAHV